MKESILGFEQEMSTTTEGVILTRLDFAFMTDSTFNFGTMDPNHLPTSPTALNVYILRNQSILMTNIMHTDNTMNLEFAGFKNQIDTTFGQTIEVDTHCEIWWDKSNAVHNRGRWSRKTPDACKTVNKCCGDTEWPPCVTNIENTMYLGFL